MDRPHKDIADALDAELQRDFGRVSKDPNAMISMLGEIQIQREMDFADETLKGMVPKSHQVFSIVDSSLCYWNSISAAVLDSRNEE